MSSGEDTGHSQYSHSNRGSGGVAGGQRNSGNLRLHGTPTSPNARDPSGHAHDDPAGDRRSAHTGRERADSAESRKRLVYVVDSD